MVRGRCPRLRRQSPFGLINWGEDRVEKYPNSRCTISAIPTCDLTFKTQPERLSSIVAEGNTLGTKPPNSFSPVRGNQVPCYVSPMPQSLHSLTCHIIFSTKTRHPWLTPDIRPRV